MLRPSKHSHPDRTVISVVALLIARLSTRRVDNYSDLRKVVKNRIVGGDALFLPALNLMYLLGLIEYRPKTDAIEYTGQR